MSLLKSLLALKNASEGFESLFKRKSSSYNFLCGIKITSIYHILLILCLLSCEVSLIPSPLCMLITQICLSATVCQRLNFVIMVCFFLLRESRNQVSTITSRRRMYSDDDALSEEKLSPTLSMSEASYQSERVEEKGTSHPTEIPKQGSTTFAKREDSATAEIQLPSKSPVEEQRPASLSSHHSLSTQMESTRVSAFLPRSYQKTDTVRLTSVVTPRPFGSQSKGISSLPRSYTVKSIPDSFSFFSRDKCWLTGSEV